MEIKGTIILKFSTELADEFAKLEGRQTAYYGRKDGSGRARRGAKVVATALQIWDLMWI